MAKDPAARSASIVKPGAGSGVRIGDAERERAVQSLGEHLRAGRLTAAEYDERLEHAFAARTAPDLAPLFLDLPGGSPLTPPAPEQPRRTRRRGYRTVPVPLRAVVLLAIIAAAIVFAAFAAFPPLFLIPVLWFVFARRAFGHRRYGYGGPRRY